jgi:hypothetical protein
LEKFVNIQGLGQVMSRASGHETIHLPFGGIGTNDDDWNVARC